MDCNKQKQFSTLSTLDVENSVENVKSVENSKCCVENSMIKIPFIVHEAEIAILERHIKRLWVALIVAIVLIFISNIAWLAYINQYDFESYEISTDGGGNANYIGNDGDIYNGKNSGQEKNEEER